MDHFGNWSVAVPRILSVIAAGAFHRVDSVAELAPPELFHDLRLAFVKLCVTVRFVDVLDVVVVVLPGVKGPVAAAELWVRVGVVVDWKFVLTINE